VTGTPVDRSGAVTMLVSGNDVYLVYPTGITGYLVVSGDEMKGELDGNSTGLRVISVDYALAPHAKYNQMSDEVVAAIQTLLKQGQRLEDLAIYGDSSGGGLAAAVVLKMRDAAAFADPKHQKDPYASPVYGDFSKGFPATLIQGGLKETLLSGFVRLYQALDAAGVPVKLDLYEGMIHNFQDRIPDAPESILARKKMRDCLCQHLGL